MAIQAEQLLWMINNERARRWGSWSPDRLNNPQTMADLIREDFPAARGGLGVEDVRSFFRTLAENGAVRQAMQTYQAAHPGAWRTVLALAGSPAIDVDNGRGIAWRPGMLNPADRIMAGLAVVQSSLTASVTYVSCVNNNVDNDEAVAWAAFAGGVADIVQVSAELVVAEAGEDRALDDRAHGERLVGRHPRDVLAAELREPPADRDGRGQTSHAETD